MEFVILLLYYDNTSTMDTNELISATRANPPVTDDHVILASSPYIPFEKYYCFMFVGAQYDLGFQGSNISHTKYYIFQYKYY